jgi:hypothetical protein
VLWLVARYDIAVINPAAIIKIIGVTACSGPLRQTRRASELSPPHSARCIWAFAVIVVCGRRGGSDLDRSRLNFFAAHVHPITLKLWASLAQEFA